VAPVRPSCIVVGVGNRDRGDDGAGPEVARLLRGTLPADVAIAEGEGEAAALMARFEGMERAYLVDACASGGTPGAVRRFDAQESPLPPGASGLSTHGFGLAEAVELARAMDRLPPRCIVYAIEGASFDTGAPLSPAVTRAAAEVARRLRAEIAGQDAEEHEASCTKPR